MTQIELAADVLQRNLELLKTTLADFSDTELLVRPAPSANHAAWQLGHLATSESNLLNAVRPGAVTPVPPAFAEKFNKQTAAIDDPSFFPKKAQLLDTLLNLRTATVAWVKTLTPVDLDQPMPEKYRARIATVGHLLAMLPSHVAMHVGQFQVIRRKLGKPLLF